MIAHQEKYVASTTRLQLVLSAPSAKDLSLGLAADTDLGVSGHLVGEKASASNEGNSHNCNDGISRRVTEPSLLERLVSNGRAGKTGLNQTRTGEYNC